MSNLSEADFLQLFFSSLEKEGVRYAVLHGWEGLPAEIASDLDIVADPGNSGRIEKIIAGIPGARLLQLLQYESTSRCFVAAIGERNEIKFLAIDVATDIRDGGRVFFGADELLEGRVRRGPFWATAPRAEFVYLLWKKIQKGRVPPRQRMRIEALWGDPETGAAEAVLRLLGPKWGGRVATWVAEGNWESFESHIAELKRALRAEALRRNPFGAARFWIPELSRLLARWRHPTGLSIAVLGPDGAGKSALLDRLESGLAGAFRNKARFHFGLPADSGRAPVTNPHGKPPRSLPASLLKVVYYALRYRFRWLLQARTVMARHGLVLFDRHFDDLLIDPLRYRYGGPAWWVRLWGLVVPRPDLYFVLGVPEGRASERNVEVSPKEAFRQRKAYRELSGQLPGSVLLDAGLSESEVALHAADVVLGLLRERYAGQRRRWFSTERREDLDWAGEVLGRIPPGTAWLPIRDGRAYLIPTQSAAAASASLNLYGASRVSSRCAKALLRAALRLGLGRLLLQRADEVADGPRNCEAKPSAFSAVSEVLDRSDLCFGVSLGTPGPGRKPVIAALTPSGEVAAFVKVGWDNVSKLLVRNEKETLDMLSRKGSAAFLAPTAMAELERDDRLLCAQSPLPAGAPSPTRLVPAMIEAVKSMSEINRHSAPLEASPFWKEVRSRRDRMRESVWRQTLARGILFLESAPQAAALPFHFSHGDFAPWNMAAKQSTTMIFDWESASAERTAGWDLFHFAMQTGILLRGLSARGIQDEVLGGGFYSQCRDYFASMGISENDLRPLWLAYVLDRLSNAGCESVPPSRMLSSAAGVVQLLLESPEARGNA